MFAIVRALCDLGELGEEVCEIAFQVIDLRQSLGRSGVPGRTRTQ